MKALPLLPSALKKNLKIEERKNEISQNFQLQNGVNC